MRNLKLTISYDGSFYHGYQAQDGCETIQGVMESVLSEIMKEPITVSGSSRTDAGVHARRYVMNFNTNCRIPADRVAIALNTKLPPDIRAIKCMEIRQDFHARFDTVSKTYKYFINDSSYNIFMRNYLWQISRPLDVAAMKNAASYIIGEHYFDAFMAAGSQAKDTLRCVNSLTVERNPDGIIEITINANGYLYNMVRIISGTLMGVGLKRFLPEDIKTIIESRDRTNAGVTAPARGLFLWDVIYREEDSD